jgi:hypothetical protein
MAMIQADACDTVLFVFQVKQQEQMKFCVTCRLVFTVHHKLRVQTHSPLHHNRKKHVCFCGFLEGDSYVGDFTSISGILVL